MERKYSKVYKTENGRKFRYNYKEQILEYITDRDFDFENDVMIEIKLPDFVVIDSVGLRVENWKENPTYWVDRYDDEIDMEIWG